MEGRKQVSYTPINKNEKYDKVMEEFRLARSLCFSFFATEEDFTYDGNIRDRDFEELPNKIWDLSNLYTDYCLIAYHYRRTYKQDYFKKFQNKNLQKINKDMLIKFLNSYGIKIKYSNWIKKNNLIKFIKNIDCENLFDKYKKYYTITLHYNDIVVD